METGVSHNKRQLHRVGYFRDLMASNENIDDSIRPLLQLSRDTITRLQKTESVLVRSLQRDPSLTARVQRLKTVPGVGPITALTWALEIGDISRFRSIRHAISYCRLCGDEKKSAEKVVRTPLSGQRNKHIQSVLVEAAKLAPRYDHDLALVYENEKKKGNVNRATLADPAVPSRNNHNFWTFAPANPFSGYLNRYHVRFGPAENPAASVRDDGLFALHYVHLAAELWLDSTQGWLAVVDGDSRYAMVERFRYQENETYPGKASIIFWTNGPELKLNSDGMPSLTSGNQGESPYYLEAEINTPLVRLRPGETRDLDAEWFPTRAGGEFHGVEDAGIVVHPLQATSLETGNIRLSGSFGAFFAGRLVAHFYGEHGVSLGAMRLAQVDPAVLVLLEMELTPPAKPCRISLHLEDENGLDRGSLQEVRVCALESP